MTIGDEVGPRSRASQDLVRVSIRGSRVEIPGEETGGPLSNNKQILLQGFNWDCHSKRNPSWYRILADKAGAIADLGITALWLPPPSVSVSREGYMPRELEDLNSCYGTESDLQQCISALHSHRVKVLADVVINHRCATHQGNDGKWNVFGGQYAWNAQEICCSNPDFGGKGSPKEGEDFTAAPNIDHKAERVGQDLKQWLSWLREKHGFDGWRFDFAKGYSPCHTKDYIEATKPALAVAEFWDTCEYDEAGVLLPCQDAHRQRTVDWCDGAGGMCAAFDFTTKAVLQEAVAKREFWRLKDSAGKPPGVLGWWPSRAVSFLENHDTGSSQNHWPFPAQHLQQGYVYLLTHPGTPCIFYDHLWTDGLGHTSVWRTLKRALLAGSPSGSFLQRSLRSCITDLIAIRRRSGIHATSEVHIHEANGSVYAATVDNKVAMKIGPGVWDPHGAGIHVGQTSWYLSISGTSFAVWEAKF